MARSRRLLTHTNPPRGMAAAVLPLLLLLLSAGAGARPPPKAGHGGGHGGEDFRVVRTAKGLVRGRASAEGVAFLGLAYARPPVDDLRLEDPQPLEEWAGVWDALEPKPWCLQSRQNGTYEPRSDEDCLYLNVWVPPGADLAGGPGAARLPVMTFIHGGGFLRGSAMDPYFAYGKHIAGTGEPTVVVTVNYRLGAVGWLPTEARPTGNFGFKDQQAALRWVRDNIGAFGGDADNVTIFGQSAGGFSVLLHMIARDSEGLFARAIAESAPASIELMTPHVARKVVRKFNAHTACHAIRDLAALQKCWRGLDQREILAAETKVSFVSDPLLLLYAGLPWPPQLDGANLRGQIVPEFERLAQREPSPLVPLMIGAAKEDARPFIKTFKDRLNEAEELALLGLLLWKHPLVLAELKFAYRDLGSFADETEQVQEMVTDGLFFCPAARLARAVGAAGRASFLYSFQHPRAKGWSPEWHKMCAGHSCHDVELPYVFGTYSQLDRAPAEVQLQEDVMGYWRRFAHRGDPGPSEGAAAMPWTDFTTTQETMLLDVRPALGMARVKERACRIWYRTGYKFT